MAETSEVKRGRGRPPGSKNANTIKSNSGAGNAQPVTLGYRIDRSDDTVNLAVYAIRSMSDTGVKGSKADIKYSVVADDKGAKSWALVSMALGSKSYSGFCDAAQYAVKFVATNLIDTLTGLDKGRAVRLIVDTRNSTLTPASMITAGSVFFVPGAPDAQGVESRVVSVIALSENDARGKIAARWANPTDMSKLAAWAGAGMTVRQDSTATMIVVPVADIVAIK